MGTGIYSNTELIDSLIVDCNYAVKCCHCGEYVAFCSTIVQMVQKLGNLKTGVQNDIQNRETNIRFLEKRLSDLGHPIDKIDANDLVKGGAEDGKD